MADASSIVAVFALVFWSFQLAPQAALSYRRQSTDGLSPLLLLSWSLASSLTAVNNIATRLSPLFVVQPNLFLLFSLTCYTQCYYYPPATAAATGSATPVDATDTATSSAVSTPSAASTLQPRPTPLRAAAHGIVALLVCLAVQLAVSLPLLPLHPSPSSPSLLVVNLLSLLLFLLAFLPQYAAILRARSAAGVSLLFLCIDMTGAVLSTVALALTSDFEVVEAVSYIGVFVGDGVIVGMKLCLPDTAQASSTAEQGGVEREQQYEVDEQREERNERLQSMEVIQLDNHKQSLDVANANCEAQMTVEWTPE